LARASEHNLLVNNPPLSIYLHAGGANAVYYDLVANGEGKLSYIEGVLKLQFRGKRWCLLGGLSTRYWMLSSVTLNCLWR
jgi:hypothetical protein